MIKYNNKTTPYPAIYSPYDDSALSKYIYKVYGNSMIETVYIVCNHHNLHNLYVQSKIKTKVEIQSTSFHFHMFNKDVLSLTTNIKQTVFHGDSLNGIATDNCIPFMMWLCAQSFDNLQWYICNKYPDNIDDNITGKIDISYFLFYSDSEYKHNNDIQDYADTPGFVVIDPKHNPRKRVSDLSEFYNSISLPWIDAEDNLSTAAHMIAKFLRDNDMINERLVFTGLELYCEKKHVYDFFKKTLTPISSVDDVSALFPYHIKYRTNYNQYDYPEIIAISQSETFATFGKLAPSPYLLESGDIKYHSLLQNNLGLNTLFIPIDDPISRGLTVFYKKPVFLHQLQSVDMIEMYLIKAGMRYLLFKDESQLVLAKLHVDFNSD